MLGFIPPALKRTLSEFKVRRTDYLRKNLGRCPWDPALFSLGNGPHASCLPEVSQKVCCPYTCRPAPPRRAPASLIPLPFGSQAVPFCTNNGKTRPNSAPCCFSECGTGSVRCFLAWLCLPGCEGAHQHWGCPTGSVRKLDSLEEQVGSSVRIQQGVSVGSKQGGRSLEPWASFLRVKAQSADVSKASTCSNASTHALRSYWAVVVSPIPAL